MESTDYRELFNNNTTSSMDDNEVIIISVVSTSFGILLFLCFCCCFSQHFSTWIDNMVITVGDSDNNYGDVALRRMQEEEEKKKEDPEVRKEKLLLSFERNRVSMVVTESSFVKTHNLTKTKSTESLTLTDDTTDSEFSDSNHSEEKDKDQKDGDENSDIVPCHEIESGNEPNEIYLPTSHSTVKIPNCCAICLCSYDVGDTIIWSCDKDCVHAFHDECIIPWLVKNQSGECPCCRRQFTDLPPPDGKQKKSDARPSVWSIRSWFLRLRYTFVTRNDVGNDAVNDATIV